MCFICKQMYHIFKIKRRYKKWTFCAASAPLPPPADIEPLPEVAIIAASRRLLRDFERGIVEGTSPSPNFFDGLRTQLVLDAARESARTGRVVAVPPS